MSTVGLLSCVVETLGATLGYSHSVSFLVNPEIAPGVSIANFSISETAMTTFTQSQSASSTDSSSADGTGGVIV